MRTKKSISLIIFLLLVFPCSLFAQDYKPGLIGTYFNSRTFVEPDNSVDIIPSLDINWEKSRGSDWSARWHGYIEVPVSSRIKFFVDVKDAFLMFINGRTVIDGLDESGAREGEYDLDAGVKYPIEVHYISLYGKAKVHLYWEWEGKERSIVPSSAFSYDANELPENYKVFDFDNRTFAGDEEDKGVVTDLPRFTGGFPPYADTDYHDGQFRPAVGVHNYKIVRSNRKFPELVTEVVPNYPDSEFKDTGFTYNHQPMICYWKDKFWVFYESGPVHEHQSPCYGLITWSEDKNNWAMPQEIFPAFQFINRKHENRLEYSLSHQRSGFYIAPDGRLLVIGFYGLEGSPNDGKGVGRAIREIKGPGNYGPLYWVRYNEYQGYSRENSPHFPYYKDAEDEGFIKAVDALLADKLMVQQWFEEDQDNTDNFFVYADRNTRYLKAFDWYTLPDQRIVGMWKWRRLVVADKWEPGKISMQGLGENIYYGGAKIWGQKTSDNKYALIYNPVKNTTYRHPLAVTTSSDGLNFDTYFLNVHSETPLMRYGGGNKDGGGGQYIRGISEGNGTPSDGDVWLTYSSNKEDIFATHVPVPIVGTVDEDVDEDFENVEPREFIPGWNIYTGSWNEVAVAEVDNNNVLRFQDKDPYDYAKAVKVFPETLKSEISFRISANQVKDGAMEIEVLNYKGQRPVRIIVDGNDGKVKACDGENMVDVASYEKETWIDFKLSVDTEKSSYSIKLNEAAVLENAKFAETLNNEDNPYKSKFEIPTIERIEFRTGKYRMKDFSRYGYGANEFLRYEPDLPNPDDALENAVFQLDDVKIITSE